MCCDHMALRHVHTYNCISARGRPSSELRHKCRDPQMPSRPAVRGRARQAFTHPPPLTPCGFPSVEQEKQRSRACVRLFTLRSCACVRVFTLMSRAVAHFHVEVLCLCVFTLRSCACVRIFILKSCACVCVFISRSLACVSEIMCCVCVFILMSRAVCAFSY